MNGPCRRSRQERGHYAIVDYDGDQPIVLGCIQCDWGSVVHGDIGDELEPGARSVRRIIVDEPRRCMQVKHDGGRCSLSADYGDRCRRHWSRERYLHEVLDAFRSPWRDISLPEAYREAFIRAIQDANLIADDQHVTRETFERARALRHRSVVYFVEREGLVKIGTTTNLRSRLLQLGQGGCKMPQGVTVGPVELLATTPGDRQIESRYHERFRKQRVGGEWFRPNKALLRLIEDLQRVERDGRGDILDQVLGAA